MTVLVCVKIIVMSVAYKMAGGSMCFRILILIMILSGCQAEGGVKQYLNRLNFNLTGGSFFSDASEVKVKQVLLDNGTLLGREVIVEGLLVDAGDFATHLIIKDKTGQMLVLLTDVDNILRKIDAISQKKIIRVLGTVERGKLGLPYLGAVAVVGMDVTDVD